MNQQIIKITLVVLIISSSIIKLHGQIKGLIIEKETKLPIAFASIIYQKETQQKGIISDIYGKFEIKDNNINNLTVSCIGYKLKKVELSTFTPKANFVIELELSTQELNEIIITPLNNPAIKIIRNVLKNKEKNNYKNYNEYTYQCYVKTLIDIKLANDANAQDSLKINNNKKIKKQAAFISEYVVSCLKSESKNENKIIAHKTSGIEDPILAQLFTTLFHHSISFYNNSVSLFELPISDDKSTTEFISPLSEGCLKIYNYQLQDTIINEVDSIFVIDFYPKKNTNVNSLKGKLYISSNGYAIKNIIVEPAEKGLIGFKFKQEYEFIDNKWFPSKLEEEIGWVKQKIKNNINAYPIYLITSTIDSVSYIPALSKKSNNYENVYVDENTIKKSDSIINLARKDTLTYREKNTYNVIDSIGKKNNFEYWVKLYPKLANRRIPIKYIDIDYSKLYNYNKYEGSRLGISMFTNEKVLKNISLGGFVGYGLVDKKYKYGGQLIVDLNKNNDVQLKLSYQNNLQETGFNLNEDYSTQFFNKYLRSYIGYRFDNYIENKIELNFRTLQYFKISTSLNLNKIHPLYSYLYKGSALTEYKTEEIQINIQYAYNFDQSTILNQKVINFNGNPIINFTYKRGINLFDNKSLKYNKIESTIDYTAYNGRIGQSDFKLATGYVDQDLPYGLLFTGEGSKNNDIPLLINNSFQTMSPYEFLSDKYINLFYSHNFNSLLFSTKKFKPQFVIVQNSGWGTLTNHAVSGLNFKKKDKIYLESGLIINNLIKLKYLNILYFNLGIGGFYRYGYYGYNSLEENIALKVSLTISLR